MKFRSVFDIIGPIMLGPSSSHTAGAARIGFLARKLFAAEPTKVNIHLFGSFAKTYRGHATDVAIVGGILGMQVDDPLLPASIDIAHEKGITIHFIPEEARTSHPNTVTLELFRDDDWLSITGISIGGGAVQIIDYSGFALSFSGENPTLLILHQDAFGAIAAVTNCLVAEAVNVAHMEVSRLTKGEMALMVIETDSRPSDAVIRRISEQEHILKIVILDAQ